MKVVINFNGTFTGLVYSSGYVHDANCIYVNGTGRNGYEFYIRLASWFKIFEYFIEN